MPMSLQNPLKDILSELEQRFHGGRTIGTVLLALIVLAVGVFCLEVLWGAGKAVVSILPTSFSVPLTWRDWASLGLVAVLYATGFFLIRRRIRRLEIAAENATLHRDLDRDMDGINDSVRKQVDGLEERLAYVEKKIGDELTDLLTERALQQEREQKILPQQTPENSNVALARTLLFEAAAQARNAADGKAKNIDEVGEHAVLHLQIIQFIQGIFGYRVVADFEEFQRIGDKKDDIRGVTPDGRRHFIQLADYLESLGAHLESKDLDPQADLPRTFSQFRALHN